MASWMIIDELYGAKKKRLHGQQWYEADDAIYVPSAIWAMF